MSAVPVHMGGETVLYFENHGYLCNEGYDIVPLVLLVQVEPSTGFYSAFAD